MIYSKSADYAIRSLVYLAQQGEGNVLTPDIVDATGVSYTYLGRILQSLARSGMLLSSKGPKGGFTLAKPPEEIALVDVVNSVWGHELIEPNGIKYKPWQDLQKQIFTYLRETTIADLAGIR